MKKKIQKNLCFFFPGLLLVLGTAFATGDSLISLSYLQDTYLSIMKQAISQGATQAVDTVYNEKLEELEALRETYQDGEGSSNIFTLSPGTEVFLGEGAVMYPLDGELTLHFSGTVVDLTTGNLVAGNSLQLGHQYLVAESSAAVLLCGMTSAQIALEGNYQMGQIESSGDSQFLDVSTSDWFYTGVNFVKNTGLFSGTEYAIFSPYLEMNRGMMVTVLYRLAGSPQSEMDTATASFLDVSESDWYGKYVRWSADRSIVAGMGDGYFLPETSVTRQQIAVMLYAFSQRYLGLDMNHNSNLDQFQDENQVATWARVEMEWVVARGLLYGIPESSYLLKAEEYASRAEVATMLMNFYQFVLSH